MPLNGAGPDHYATRFLSKSFGFAMGWNYWYAYAILVPFEITAAVLIIHYWGPPVHDAVFITILLVVIVGLNYLPARDTGEAEFAFSSLKIGLLIGLMILSVVLAAGGGPSGDAVGFRYWHNPGPAQPWIVEGGTGIFVSFLGVVVSVVLPVSMPYPTRRYFATDVCFPASSHLPSKWWPPAEASRPTLKDTSPRRQRPLPSASSSSTSSPSWA